MTSSGGVVYRDIEATTINVEPLCYLTLKFKFIVNFIRLFAFRANDRKVSGC